MNVDFLFSDALKRAVQASGKKQKEIAEDAGIALAALANYLNGSREPQVSVAISLASACGVSIGDLLGCTSTNVDSSPVCARSKRQLTTPALHEPNPIYLDISGAMELTRSPSRRLSQLIQVAPGTLEAWESGESVPTVAQLGALFNQVVALGLARCAEHDHRPAVREERKVAAG